MSPRPDFGRAGVPSGEGTGFHTATIIHGWSPAESPGLDGIPPHSLAFRSECYLRHAGAPASRTCISRPGNDASGPFPGGARLPSPVTLKPPRGGAARTEGVALRKPQAFSARYAIARVSTQDPSPTAHSPPGGLGTFAKNSLTSGTPYSGLSDRLAPRYIGLHTSGGIAAATHSRHAICHYPPRFPLTNRKQYRTHSHLTAPLFNLTSPGYPVELSLHAMKPRKQGATALRFSKTVPSQSSAIVPAQVLCDRVLSTLPAFGPPPKLSQASSHATLALVASLHMPLCYCPR